MTPREKAGLIALTTAQPAVKNPIEIWNKMKPNQQNVWIRVSIAVEKNLLERLKDEMDRTRNQHIEEVLRYHASDGID